MGLSIGCSALGMFGLETRRVVVRIGCFRSGWRELAGARAVSARMDSDQPGRRFQLGEFLNLRNSCVFSLRICVDFF